jgi:predicted CoA-binding protein
MNTRRDVQDFLAQETLALVGMSRAPHSFSAIAAKELKAKGYRLLPVNPRAAEIQGEKCYPSLSSLPEQVGGALFLIPPAATEKAVRDAAGAGVSHLWIQQGAESREAVAFCEEQNLSLVSGHCILMFAEPVGSFHRIHRCLKGLFGGLPK